MRIELFYRFISKQIVDLNGLEWSEIDGETKAVSVTLAAAFAFYLLDISISILLRFGFFGSRFCF